MNTKEMYAFASIIMGYDKSFDDFKRQFDKIIKDLSQADGRDAKPADIMKSPFV